MAKTLTCCLWTKMKMDKTKVSCFWIKMEIIDKRRKRELE